MNYPFPSDRVIRAEAGIQAFCRKILSFQQKTWVPASAGTTVEGKLPHPSAASAALGCPACSGATGIGLVELFATDAAAPARVGVGVQLLDHGTAAAPDYGRARVTAAGENVWGKIDAFHFVFSKVNANELALSGDVRFEGAGAAGVAGADEPPPPPHAASARPAMTRPGAQEASVAKPIAVSACEPDPAASAVATASRTGFAKRGESPSRSRT